jgi:Phage integrase family
MPRPRIHDTKLPAYVRIKSGAYYFKNVKLCRVSEGESAFYQALAKRIQDQTTDAIPVAVAAFCETELNKLSAPVRKEHKRLLTVFADVFKDFRVSQVEPRDIKDACDSLYSGKSSAAHHFKSRVSTFFRWAILQRMRIDNPCSEIILTKVRSKRTPWTDKLFLDVRDKLAPMMQCYHDLSFLLAQRTTDIRLLERSQIRDGVIRMEPSKTLQSSGAAVDLPVTQEIQSVLDRAATLSREWSVVCPYVIHTRQGTPYTRSGVYTAYKHADEALHDGKTTGLNPKALRPYALTKARAMGYSKEQLQTTAAHASLGTTEGYLQGHEVPVSAVVLKLPER